MHNHAYAHMQNRKWKTKNLAKNGKGNPCKCRKGHWLTRGTDGTGFLLETNVSNKNKLSSSTGVNEGRREIKKMYSVVAGGRLGEWRGRALYCKPFWRVGANQLPWRGFFGEGVL